MLKNMLISILLAAASGCGQASDKPAPTPPSDEQLAAFDAAADRALDMSEPRGWIVSRWEDGRVEHTGDSLLWTGMAMGLLDCARGDEAEAALLDMLTSNGGRAYRHPSEAAREPSLDGHLGLYWGIAQRVTRCPETAERWAAALEIHEPVNVGDAFDVVRVALRSRLGRGAAPSLRARDALGALVGGWAGVVRTKKAAAFRIHLGLLTLETLAAAGQPVSGSVRDAFCAASDGADMPTVDHYCGRGNLAAWVANFTYDAWEMRHQRAGAWEQPDGKPGLATPGVDLLVAYRALHTD